MKKERSLSEVAYGFSERERLSGRMNDEHFQAILEDQSTTIHEIEVATNSNGEFLFVTTSRAAGDSEPVSFSLDLGLTSIANIGFRRRGFGMRQFRLLM
jgi:hypothetical protein